jgi:predicted GIY-YIG superfamily endonuclease
MPGERSATLYTGVTTDVARRLQSIARTAGAQRAPCVAARRSRSCIAAGSGTAVSRSRSRRLRRRPRADKQAIVASRPSRQALLLRLGLSNPRQGE